MQMQLNLEDKNERQFLFWELRSILMEKKSYCSVPQIGCIPTDVQGVYYL